MSNLIQTFPEYAALAFRTVAPKAFGLLDDNGQPLSGPHIDYLHALTGVSSEDGEMIGCLKANLYYGKGEDKINLVEELGDRWWYTALRYTTLASQFKVAVPNFEIQAASAYSQYIGNDDLEFGNTSFFTRSRRDKLMLLAHVAELTAGSACELSEFSDILSGALDGDGSGEDVRNFMERSIQSDEDDVAIGAGEYAFEELMALSYMLMGQNFDVRRIWTANILKLAERYGVNSKTPRFTQEDAIERLSLDEEAKIVGTVIAGA